MDMSFKLTMPVLTWYQHIGSSIRDELLTFVFQKIAVNNNGKGDDDDDGDGDGDSNDFEIVGTWVVTHFESNRKDWGENGQIWEDISGPSDYPVEAEVNKTIFYSNGTVYSYDKQTGEPIWNNAKWKLEGNKLTISVPVEGGTYVMVANIVRKSANSFTIERITSEGEAGQAGAFEQYEKITYTKLSQ
jgi:hypothetical protein